MATKPHRRPGAGTVRRLPSGRWQARRTEADGTVRSLGTWLTRAEAERALAAAELDELAGGRVLDGSGTVGEWVERWLGSSHHWRASTRAGHQSAVRSRVAPRWSAVLLADLDLPAVQQWVDEMVAGGQRPDVIRRAIAPLRGACQMAVAHRAIRADPTAGVHLPAARVREMIVLTVAQVEALAETIGQPPAGRARPDLALAVRIAAYGCLRMGVDLLAAKLAGLSSVCPPDGQFDGVHPAVVVTVGVRRAGHHRVDAGAGQRQTTGVTLHHHRWPARHVRRVGGHRLQPPGHRLAKPVFRRRLVAACEPPAGPAQPGVAWRFGD